MPLYVNNMKNYRINCSLV